MEDKLFWYLANVARIVDGDTADLEISVGLHVYVNERCRLYGIDAPETYGKRKNSKEYVEIFLPGEDMSINQLMITKGLATEYFGGKKK